jgi:hypothetical protein
MTSPSPLYKQAVCQSDGSDAKGGFLKQRLALLSIDSVM